MTVNLKWSEVSRESLLPRTCFAAHDCAGDSLTLCVASRCLWMAQQLSHLTLFLSHTHKHTHFFSLFSVSCSPSFTSLHYPRIPFNPAPSFSPTSHCQANIAVGVCTWCQQGEKVECSHSPCCCASCLTDTRPGV